MHGLKEATGRATDRAIKEKFLGRVWSRPIVIYQAALTYIYI